MFVILSIILLAATIALIWLYRIYFAGALPAAPHAELLGTSTKSTSIFHQFLVNPAMLDDFKHDAILLCFEKVNRRKLIVENGRRGYYSVDAQYAAFNIDRNLEQMTAKGLHEATRLVSSTLNDPKPIVLTHWVETTPERHTIRYSAYKSIKGVDYNLPKAGLEQFEAVTTLVKNKLQTGSFTHLVIGCSGWNNYQDHSKSLYADWLSFTKAAAEDDKRGEDYRPLFIGFTWASRWITPGLSFFNKANDADELGMTHISTLLYQYLLPALDNTRVPVITIGHSFGGRVISRANHSRFMQKGVDMSGWIDIEIDFQGAYPVTRFFEKGGSNGGLYTVDVPVKKHYMTCSEYDSAIKKPIWSVGYIGDNLSLTLLPRNPIAKNNFEFTSVDATGRFNSLAHTKPKILVDGKATISKMGSKAAGAHNDVHDEAAGRFIWEILQR